MKKFFFRLLILTIFVMSVFLSTYIYYYNRWNHFWKIEKPISSYDILRPMDDTLRIIMIGDSWAEIHAKMKMDHWLQNELEVNLSCPVKVCSKGKGGEKSREIYQSMFQTGSYGTKSLLQAGADYCILSAGINDAAANLGTKQFTAHYQMMIAFLLENDIRPVVLEIPNVDLWGLYVHKNKKDLLTDYVKSVMTNSEMYYYGAYREALFDMLRETGLMDSVLVVPCESWNGNGELICPSLLMEDGIHLNRLGYEKLDKGIASAIAQDLRAKP